ncbi:hypothetical protein ACIG3E_33585 [Streptomyces sp. NPDC053474]|uniref:hypothetical protein n=1 Tax=Streptomyces sp. NPDC053474 TaxID=3365704 RepID=UPI0037D4E3C9
MSVPQHHDDVEDSDGALDEALPEDTLAELCGSTLREDPTDDAQPPGSRTATAIVQPARQWPQFNHDRARAELLAMEMITRGAPYLRVRRITGLSPEAVRRLQDLVAEEAANPVIPRNVCRHPASRRTPNTRSDAPVPLRHPAPQPAPSEPIQMTLALDC